MARTKMMPTPPLPSKSLNRTSSRRVQKPQTKRALPKSKKTAIHGTNALPDRAFRLLDLAPELRNVIYEMILVEPDPIEVDFMTRIPDILQVNRQIRAEASGIWYKLNEFDIDVQDCDATELNRWASHCCDVNQRECNVNIDINGMEDWVNPKKWAKAVWKDDRSRVLFEAEDSDEMQTTICAALQIATNFKGSSWGLFKDALMELRCEVSATNPDWWYFGSEPELESEVKADPDLDPDANFDGEPKPKRVKGRRNARR